MSYTTKLTPVQYAKLFINLEWGEACSDDEGVHNLFTEELRCYYYRMGCVPYHLFDGVDHLTKEEY